MKAELNVVKFNVEDVVTTSVNTKCATPGLLVEVEDE